MTCRYRKAFYLTTCLVVANAISAAGAWAAGTPAVPVNPNGIGGVGYREQDLEALTTGAWAQQRLITNAAREVQRSDLSNIFRGALSYW